MAAVSLAAGARERDDRHTVLRTLILGLVASAGILLSPGMAAAQQPPGSATLQESTVYAPAGTGDAEVDWSASCSAQYWYVNTDALHQDGSHANHQSTAESGGTTSDSRTHGLILTMAEGLQSETFHITVKLTCDPNPETIIGDLSITLTRCNPEDLNNVDRDYAMAAQLRDLGVKELTDSHTHLRHFAREYGKESAEIGVEKYDMLQLLQLGLSHTAVTAVEVAAAIAGTILTGQQLYIAWQDYSRLRKGADDDFKLSEGYANKGDEDLKGALAAHGCLEPDEARIDKLRKEQKREEDARNIIESWENNGVLYFSPISHERVTEGLALKQARAALTGGKAKGSAAARAARRHKVTLAQVRRALRHIRKASRVAAKIHSKLKHLEPATATAIKRLKALVSG
jgi:hypothetical protein